MAEAIWRSGWELGDQPLFNNQQSIGVGARVDWRRWEGWGLRFWLGHRGFAEKLWYSHETQVRTWGVWSCRGLDGLGFVDEGLVARKGSRAGSIRVSLALSRD